MQDVGAVGLIGDSNYDTATSQFTVQGAGADITAKADAFQFMSTDWTGDGNFVVKVEGINAASALAKAGLMVREGVGADAKYFALFATPGNGLLSQRRTTVAANTTLVPVVAPNAPVWLKIVRRGNTFTGYYSTDGATWQPTNRDGVTLTATVKVGLAVTSKDVTSLATAQFSNVTLTAYNDLTVPTVPTNLSNAEPSDINISLQWTAAQDDVGVAYYEIWRNGVKLGTSNVTSYEDRRLPHNTAYNYKIRAFDTRGRVSAYSPEVNLSTVAKWIPAPWEHQDIGDARPGGVALYDSGTNRWTIKAGGSDIWGKADQFHYVHQSLTGDGSVIARVESLTNPHLYAKVGIMLRESTAVDAAHVAIHLNPSGRVEFLKRLATGEVTTATTKSGVNAPLWVKLTRRGNTITGYESTDGQTWRIVAETPVTFASVLRAGLSVTSHLQGTAIEGILSNVQVQAGLPVDTQPPGNPTNLVAASRTDVSARLTWKVAADDTGVQRYRILRDGVEVGVTPTLAWVDSGLTPKKAYIYQVRAVDFGGNESSGANVTVTTTAANLPSPWKHLDIGSTTYLGSATLSGTTGTIKGSGLDIWGSADAFHYVYQNWSTDQEIVTRLESLLDNNPTAAIDAWAKGGVMLREGTAPGARHLSIVVTPQNGLAVIRRTVTGEATELIPITSTGTGAPIWVKVRTYNSEARIYTSSDGQNWTLVRAESIADWTDLKLGYAVTSRSNSKLSVLSVSNRGTLNLATDSDADGLPDAWELQQFGNLSQSGLNDADYDQDGLSNFTEFLAGSNPKDYFNGQTPILKLISGNNQPASPNSLLPQPLLVRVENEQGLPLRHIRVRWSLTQGGGAFGPTPAPLQTTPVEIDTDAQGQAALFFQTPASEGTSQIRASVGSGSQVLSILFTARTAPLPLSGLQLWLDGSAGVETDSNNHVTRWTDQSGNGNDAQQVDLAARPTLENNFTSTTKAVNFNGSQWMSGTENALIEGACSVFLVARFDQRGPKSRWGQYATPIRLKTIPGFEMSVVVGYDGTSDTAPEFVYTWLSGRGYNQLGAKIRLSNYLGKISLFRHLYNGVNFDQVENFEAALNGKLLTQYLSFGEAGGGGNVNEYGRDLYETGNVIGSIAEMVVYNRKLTPLETQAVEAYLNSKYNISSGIIDFDADGMDDDWELDNFGDLSHLATTDTDGDQLSDFAEYQAGTNPNDPDTDYDGRSDGEEIAEATNPLDPASFTKVKLASWSFNGTYQGDQGQQPLQATNITRANNWNNQGVVFPNSWPTHLQYKDVEADGKANINLRSGTVSFWFKPDWSSATAGGVGPGEWSRFVQIGGWTPDNTTPRWELLISYDGGGFGLNTTSGKGSDDFIGGGFGNPWQANQWYQVVVAYDRDETRYYRDGQLVATGPGVGDHYPDAATRKNFGIRFGSSVSFGSESIRGQIDEIATYNYPLTPAEIIAAYQQRQQLDSDQDELPDAWELAQFGDLTHDQNSDEDGDTIPDLDEYHAGTDPKDYYNGALPTLEIISEPNPSAPPSTLLAQPLTVRVKNALGQPLANAPVLFTITSLGDAKIGLTAATLQTASLPVKTTSSGLAQVLFQTPSSSGTTQILAATAMGSTVLQASFTVTTLPPTLQPPAAPSNLQAVIQSDQSVQLSWTDNSDNETSFILEKSSDGGQTWQGIAMVGANQTSYHYIPSGISAAEQQNRAIAALFGLNTAYAQATTSDKFAVASNNGAGSSTREIKQATSGGGTGGGSGGGGTGGGGPNPPTPQDRDGDGLNDDEDAVPDKTEMKVRAAADANYAVIRLGTVSSVGSPSGLNDRGEVLLRKDSGQNSSFSFWSKGESKLVTSEPLGAAGPLNNGDVYIYKEVVVSGSAADYYNKAKRCLWSANGGENEDGFNYYNKVIAHEIR